MCKGKEISDTTDCRVERQCDKTNIKNGIRQSKVRGEFNKFVELGV